MHTSTKLKRVVWHQFEGYVTTLYQLRNLLMNNGTRDHFICDDLEGPGRKRSCSIERYCPGTETKEYQGNLQSAYTMAKTRIVYLLNTS
jgi:hypothetical protein